MLTSALVSFCLSLLPGATFTPRGTPLARAAVLLQEAPVEIQEPELKSNVGFDFVPLLTALKAQDFLEADDLTRSGLITLAGEAAVKRGYVYFSEVPKLPKEDMATMERLWQVYSDGKFGYSVQAKVFNSKKCSRTLEKMYTQIGWSKPDGSLLRWLPGGNAKGDEFIYELEKAPKGHLPLTSTLRGTQLLLNLLDLEVWKDDEFSK